jgi:Protein of unknown function (DUF3300)
VAQEGKNRHRESTIAGPGHEPGGREHFVAVVNRVSRGLVLSSIVLLAGVLGPSPAHSQSSPAPPSAAQLDKLVAPIALYPDPLVAQILPASTYPVEVIEAERALASGKRPSKATASQWDPSIQALLSYPTVLKMMSDKISWTTQLGQAVAANQGDVMAAIQRVRHQAQAAGNLRSNDKQLVSVQGSGDTSTIVVEPANPQVIYVPQYNPVAILSPAPAYYYGNPAYGLLTFGAGFAAGAATAYACNWGYYGGYGSLTVNNYYHYNQNNVYHGYNSATGAHGVYNPATGNSASYHPQSGTYTGYDAKTGTYGAYNPSTGKYGTYDPSTGAYNKNGTTGTWKPGQNAGSSEWHPRSASDVGRSTDEYRANQYRAGGASGSQYSGGDLASGSRYGGTASGNQYRGGDLARGAGGGSSSGGSLGGERSLGSTGGSNGLGDRGFGGGWGGGDRFGGGGGDRGFGGFSAGSVGDRGFGNDAFRGLGGGGWDARAASNRGFGSFGGRGFGGFRGGGFRR